MHRRSRRAPPSPAAGDGRPVRGLSEHMPSILALEKISKRFGAVVVADAHRPRARRGRGARHHRTERRRQDHAVRHRDRHGARPTPGASSSPAATSPGCAPERRCRMGIGALVPDPAAVRRHDRVREPGGGGGVRRRPGRARRLSALRRVARAMRPRRQGEPAGRRAHAARPQAAGACARARDPAARASARRGRRRPDRARMRGAGRPDQGVFAAAASRSSGSSTSCMR